MMPSSTDSTEPKTPLTSPAAAPVSATPLSRAVDGLVHWIARHWLALFNTGWGLYLGLPLLAPLLLWLGLTTPARLIYVVYSVTCHQLPDHSYFLFGADLAPDRPTLEAAGMTPTPDLFQQRWFIGTPAFGYKVAICQRDVAIYSAVLLAGLAYIWLRRRTGMVSFKVYLLFLIPIAVDGGTQLFGLRESNWELRTLTGMLFGAASVWFAYPYIDDAMQEVLENEQYQPR